MSNFLARIKASTKPLRERVARSLSFPEKKGYRFKPKPSACSDKPYSSRFDYIAYDTESACEQEFFKDMFINTEAFGKL